MFPLPQQVQQQQVQQQQEHQMEAQGWKERFLLLPQQQCRSLWTQERNFHLNCN